MTAKKPKNTKSKLSDEQKAALEKKAGNAASGWNSVGSGHKPTHASGKQAPAMKKVRW
jgi:hypothetical protein